MLNVTIPTSGYDKRNITKKSCGEDVSTLFLFVFAGMHIRSQSTVDVEILGLSFFTF